MPKKLPKSVKSPSENTQALLPPSTSEVQGSAIEQVPTAPASTPAKGKAGAPRGNRNAVKAGEDLRMEMYLSKYKRAFFEQYFELKFGRPARSDDELRETFRQLAYAALDHAMAEEFERHQPGSVTASSGETF